MAIQRSHAHLEIIINGHRFVALADEDQPYEFTWPALREGSVGADGGHYSRAIADFGCGFMVRLSDVSPSIKWCIEQRTIHLNAVREGRTIPTFSGSITDTAFGISGTFEGGTLDGEFPGWPGAANSTNEVMFDFERFVSSVGGGNFAAPLTTS